MKTLITLNSSLCALCDIKEPILMPETLEVQFTSSVYRINNLVLVVTAKNGEKQKQYKAYKENNFTIDITEMLSMGAIDLEISAYVRGNLTKDWRVPALIIRETEHKFELIPEIEELKEMLKLQAKAINDLNTIIKDKGVI